jgi:hypothetical protein
MVKAKLGTKKWRKDRSKKLKIIQNMMVNGLFQRMLDMEKVNWHGLMDPCMKAGLRMEKLVIKAEWFMQLARCIKVSGLLIKLMASASTLLAKEAIMRENGIWTSITEEEKWSKRMEVVLKECLKMINIKDMELKLMFLVSNMKEIGKKVKKKELEFKPPKMENR